MCESYYRVLHDTFNSIDRSQYSDINSPTLLPHVHNTAIPAKKADLVVAISAHAVATAPLYIALRTSDPTIRLSQMSGTSVSRLALSGCVKWASQERAMSRPVYSSVCGASQD